MVGGVAHAEDDRLVGVDRAQTGDFGRRSGLPCRGIHRLEVVYRMPCHAERINPQQNGRDASPSAHLSVAVLT